MSIYNQKWEVRKYGNDLEIWVVGSKTLYIITDTDEELLKYIVTIHNRHIETG